MIGFIGLGNMGKHMARNLLRNGLKVMAFDTNQLKLAEIQACGGEVARDVREVALKCQKVITMLPNSSHVKKVFVAENGLLRSMRPGLVCIDSSTIDQNITVEIATEVHAKGGHFFDAPVSGGVVGAEKATLTFMIGGDPNHFDMVADILRFLGQNIVYCGKVGSGQAAKICNNMLLAIEMIGVAEAMNLGINMGLEGKKLASIINSSSGRCWSSDSYNPVPDIIDGVPSSNNYSGGFGVSLMAKDLSLAQNASTLTGCPTPLGSVAHQLYRILAKVPELYLDTEMPRALHYVLKVGNRSKAYDFYVQFLGMKVLRHEEFDEGCKASCNGPYGGRWSKTMVGYGPEDDHFVIELVYNYGIRSYKLGNLFRHMYIQSEKAYERCLSSNTKVVMGVHPEIKDSDGHTFIVGKPALYSVNRICKVSLNTNDLERTREYWTGLLKLPLRQTGSEEMFTGAYDENQCEIEFVRVPRKQELVQTEYVRIAFSTLASELRELQETVRLGNGIILNELTKLATPGKATVEVIILADPNGHEVCFVGDEAFRTLSKVDMKADEMLRTAISNDKSDEISHSI